MDQIVLGRVGHYFNAGNGSCSTSVVTDVLRAPQDDAPLLVNVAAWHHDGSPFARSEVLVIDAPTVTDTASSFHLNRDCPWTR